MKYTQLILLLIAALCSMVYALPVMEKRVS